MDYSWGFLIDLGVLSLGLIIATVLRVRVRFFQRYLIPNALTAGFLLLPVYNYILPRFGFNADNLGMLVYHLLSISFISMTLRRAAENAPRVRGRIFATSMATIFPWGFQAILGLLFTLLLMRSVMPDLFPAFGMLLPLGFAQGPGQAFAIGEGWERFGFFGAGSIGLTFAAMGFLAASFGGIFMIHMGVRRGWLEQRFLDNLDTSAVKSGVYPPNAPRPVGAELTTESEALDSFTLHTALVMGTYLLSYALLSVITRGLALAGPLGEDLGVNLWGINYVFSAITAIVVRLIMVKTRLDFVIDNSTLTRLSGLSVDLMVCAAVAAISIVVVWEYIYAIAVLSILAMLLAFVTIPWFCSRMFTDHTFHRALMIFGVSTGTLPTGLALLRVIDPEFETPVASDYMYAAGITFILAIPFILAINLPAYAATTGNMLWFWLSIAVAVGYILFVMVAFLLIARGRAFTGGWRIWMPSGGSSGVHALSDAEG